MTGSSLGVIQGRPEDVIACVASNVQGEPDVFGVPVFPSRRFSVISSRRPNLQDSDTLSTSREVLHASLCMGGPAERDEDIPTHAATLTSR